MAGAESGSSRSTLLPFPERPTFGSGRLLTIVLTFSRPLDEGMPTSKLVLLLLAKVTFSAPGLMVGVMVVVVTMVVVVWVVMVMFVAFGAVPAVLFGARAVRFEAVMTGVAGMVVVFRLVSMTASGSGVSGTTLRMVTVSMLGVGSVLL